MAEVYMYIYNWQEKKGEIENPKIFVMRPWAEWSDGVIPIPDILTCSQ